MMSDVAHTQHTHTHTHTHTLSLSLSLYLLLPLYHSSARTASDAFRPHLSAVAPRPRSLSLSLVHAFGLTRRH